MSYNAADLIKKLIEPKPESRLGIKGVEEITSHPFFAGYFQFYNNIIPNLFN